MNFSDISRGGKGRLLAAILSAAIAVGLWYMVSVRDKLDAQIEVNLDYTGIPPNLVVTEGLIHKIAVRLRGPERLLRSITQSNQTESVNLSHIKKGVTVVPLAAETLDARFRAFTIVDVQPPRIVIKADNVLERSISVHAVPESPLREGVLTVENITMTPATVQLRGPESLISSIASLPLIIRLDPKAAGRTVNQTITLDTPSLVTANPSSVKQYTITSGRVTVTRRWPVTVVGGDRRRHQVEPREVELTVEVPEALARSGRYLDELEIVCMLPDIAPGKSVRLPLQFRPPEGMTIISPAVETVIVTRKAH